MVDTRDPLRFLQGEVSRLRQENQELKDELTVLRSSVRGLSAIQDLIHRMTPQTDLFTVLDDLLGSALAVLGASDGSLLLKDEETDELVFAIVRGEARERLTGYRLPPGRGIAGWVVENRQATVVQDVRKDPRFYPQVDETFGFTTQTLACVPLQDGERIVGVIEAVNKLSDREFSPEDHHLLMVVAQLATVAIRRAEKFAEQAD
ncbi:MAG: GAF domain-containing protein [Anaerolineales bacterium]|jgi:GAF domain-containing protein